MNHPSSPNPDQDNSSLDVQIEHEEIIADNNYPRITRQKSEKSNKLFSWLGITHQRINVLSERQDNCDDEEETQAQEKVNSSRYFTLEHVKSKAMAVAITIGMLPLLVSSAAVYYFGNQSLRQQTNYIWEESELLRQHVREQKRMLLFLLTGSEITALSIGIISALWAQHTVNRVALIASQASRVAVGTEKKQQYKTLAQIVRYIRQSIESEDIMANAVVKAREILKCDRVLIYQFDEDEEGKIVVESVASDYPSLSAITGVDFPSVTGSPTSYQKKYYQVIDNIYQERELDANQLNQLESFEIKSLIHIPLEQQSKVIGFLIAHQCSTPRSWQATEIELLNQIALEIGLALDDAQRVTDCLHLQKQLKQQSQWQDYLSHSSDSIRSVTNEEDILSMAVEEPRRVLNCDRVVFYRFDRDHQATVVAESVARECETILGSNVDDAYFETVYHQRYNKDRICIIDDLDRANLPSYYQKQLHQIGVKALIAAPIIHQNQLYGLLLAHQCSQASGWQETEIKWFTQVGKEIGYALDNARLMNQVKNLAPPNQNIELNQPEEKAIIKSQLPIFLEESKTTIENFSQKVLAEVDAVTPVFKQMQVMANSVQGLTSNINQTKLQTQQVDCILRSEHKNIDLTEDRLIAIQQNLNKVAVKNINLGQSCEQFRQATEKIRNLAEEINEQITKIKFRANSQEKVAEKYLIEQTEVVHHSTEQLVQKAEALNLFLGMLKVETEEIKTALESSEEKTFISIEMVQETRQNLNSLTTRNQELNQFIEKITLAATIGEQNSHLAEKSLMEVANLANQAAKKSVAVVNTIASLTNFLQRL